MNNISKEEARQIIRYWLVSSKGAIGKLGYIEGWFGKDDEEAFRMAIESLTTEPVHGEWITQEDSYEIVCGECGYEAFSKDGEWFKSDYCPNCGAKMGGDAE